MAASLAEVLRHFGPDYLRTHGLSTAQAKAWRAIVGCRTPALGGQRLRCEGCGAEAWRWHSCRNRHCPRCGARRREAWRAARMAELLDVPYCHLVFTLPHELNALAGAHGRWVYEALLRCVADTLTQFAADGRWLGGIGGFTLVLHTWTQDLRRHIHVHALMACGALGHDAEGSACWVQPKRSPRFLFPVHALSRVFKAKFLDALRHAEDDAALARDPAADRVPSMAAYATHAPFACDVVERTAMRQAHRFDGNDSPCPMARLFIVTLYDEREGPPSEDPSFTMEVWAHDRDDARSKAHRILRDQFPGQLDRVWAWCTEPRYWTDDG